MNIKETRWIKFLGGKNILFTLSILFLLGLTLLLYSELNFIFGPIFRMIAAVLTPLIISFILYYLVSPLVDFLEEKGVPRLVAIIGMYLFIHSWFNCAVIVMAYTSVTRSIRKPNKWSADVV